MHIDISSHIDKLLFLHDTVIIPGFGAFTATKSPAAVDYAGGTIAPPAKSLVFNENLTVDDGILVHDVAQSYSISTEESRKIIQEFVEKTQALLNQREIVSMPSIGRLYKNYVQKIQFLPDATNYNAESYGLPPLQFSPITRSREVSEPAATTNGSTVNGSTAASSAPPPFPAEEPRRSSGFAGVLIALLVLLSAVAGGIWWYQQKKAAGKTSTESVEAAQQESALPGPSDAVGVAEKVSSGSDDDKKPATEKETAKPGNTTERETPATKPPASNPKPAPSTEQTTSSSKGGRQCILVIATLKEKTNADRLTAKLQQNGYTVYSVVKNGYQIGVQFNYTQLTDIQKTIADLQKLTGEEDIWIKKK